MPHALSTKCKRLDEDFRALITAVQAEQNITQEEIADAIRHDQSSVHRYLSLTGDLRLPACYIRMLDTPRLLPLRFELIKWQAAGANIEVTICSPYLRKTDGRLDDEIAGIVKELGAIQATLEKHPERRAAITGHIIELENLIRRTKIEIESIEEKGI